LTAQEGKEHAGDVFPTELMSGEFAASQAEGLRILLSMAVRQSPNHRDETPVRDEQLTTVGQTPAPEQEMAAVSSAEASSGASARGERGQRQARRGRHAAKPPPYLERHGARFVVFSAIGGFVFLMGLGLQAVLTGRWDVLPVVSYLIQAVASVETSFLLNRWLTWRDRDTSFWIAFARFNVQKTVTIALNLALYAALLRLGMNYLIANVVLTAVFTVVNYVAGDRLVFIPGRTRRVEPVRSAVPALARERRWPLVSAVIPCRDNEHTIGPAVLSLLDQDYPGLREIMLIGSPGDSTWRGLADISHPRMTIWELETPPGVRDANFKRDAAVRMTSGDLIALVDSDIVLPRDWMSRAVAALEDSGAGCVAGGMKSFHDSFWGRYTDSTWIGAKTPRIADSYTVTSVNFGAHGRKPPILANVLFTRELYGHCPIDPMWSHGSYEDYEWFWRVTKAGYGIRVCRDLFGWHEHRRGLRALAREYRRSSRGCAYFIRAHRDSPLAKRRLRQALILPIVAGVAAFGAVSAVAAGYAAAVAGVVFGCAAVLGVHQVVRSRNLESIAYPAVGLALGLVFITGLVTNLIQSGFDAAAGSVIPSPPSKPLARQPASPPKWRFWPIAAICTVQAALSLTLVWSNTAYVDEADYLWVGRLEIAHWLHGTSWPSVYAYRTLSGSPVLYPPLGALASSIGGLAGARILSLAFVLIATVLLYLTASKLIGRPGALFAAGLWAFSEPAMRLAFATGDPLSVLLMALSAWLIVQAGYRHNRGELVAAAAFTLALANVTAYSGILIDPVVIAFAFLVWRTRMPVQRSLYCTAWLAGTWALSFGLLMTASHSWPGTSSTLFARNTVDHQGIWSVLGEIWVYSALIIGLALIGAVLTLQSKNRNHAALLGGLFVGAFLVMQLHNTTPWTIDLHLAYVIWFAAISAGYACGKLIEWLPGSGRQLAVICCAVALAYPAATSWQSAWDRYHAWPDASVFVKDFKKYSSVTHDGIYVPPREANIAEYYAPVSSAWTQWSGALPLAPIVPTGDSWQNFYATRLQNGNYGLIVLFYVTTFPTTGVPEDVILPEQDANTTSDLLTLVGDSSGEPGLSALTQALNASHEYRRVASGPYNTSNISGTHDYGIYVIWQRVQS
jgi:putative flippase GtrA/glycosyltransferase involved in cell wall biosynthesis